jgi:microsomal dipeptidase-like Zn-dependent dipeptidase
MRQVGPEHCILSTDFGSPHKTPPPLHPQALLEFMQALHQQGLSVDEINLMAKTNPARVLELDSLN